MHTSGHADTGAIKMVIDIVNPGMVIPMHTQAPETFKNIADITKIRIIKDKEVLTI